MTEKKRPWRLVTFGGRVWGCYMSRESAEAEQRGELPLLDLYLEHWNGTAWVRVEVKAE